VRAALASLVLLGALGGSSAHAQGVAEPAHAEGDGERDDGASGESVESADSAPPTRCPRWRRRLAPVVSLLAGPVVHGAGSFTGCHRLTGRRLGIAQGVGFGMLLVGGAGLALTGASRKTVAPFAMIGIPGVGAFFISWLADVYAAITDGRSMGRPGPNTPYELRLGYRYVHDPHFDHGSFAQAGITGWIGQHRLWVDTDVALDANTQRVRAGAARRLLGGAGRGSHLELVVAGTYQRFAEDGFRSFSGELAIGGRVDLADVAPALVGSFAIGELGLGLQGIGYEATGGGVGQDSHALLLVRVGWGVYLGRYGELVVAYDHRRDGLEGGLSVDSVGSGNLGFLQLTGRGWFGAAPRWGLAAELTAGSAWIAGLSLLHRAAPPEEPR